MEKELIEQYKERYGRVYQIKATVVDIDDDCEEKEVVFVFRQPIPLDYDRFIKDSTKKPSAAFKNLIVSCIVDEQREKLEETLKEYPALSSSLTQELLRLMGLSDSVTLKKL